MGLYARLEARLIEGLTPRQVRRLNPIPPRRATGPLARLYREIRRDFALVPPLTLLSQEPDLLAGVWAATRESQMVSGQVPRHDKEAICSAVSTTNRCAYCEDAHLGMLASLGGGKALPAIRDGEPAAIASPRLRALVAWGLAIKSPQDPAHRNPPFTAAEAPEIIGAALSFEFINRMAMVFLPDSPLPIQMKAPRLRRAGVRVFGLMARGMTAKRLVPGASLALLPPDTPPLDAPWAAAAPEVATAWGGLDAAMARAADGIPKAAKACLRARLQAWNGEAMPLGNAWVEPQLDGMNPAETASARLLLLTALAPYAVGETAIRDFRRQYPDDRALLATTAWAAYRAARRVGEWLWPPGAEGGGHSW